MDQQQPGQTGSATPQYSPDGKWWWDRQKWVAVQQAPSAQAAGGVAPASVRRKRGPGLWIGLAGALLVVMGICTVAVANSGNGNGATTTSSRPSQPPAAAAATTPTPVATLKPTPTSPPAPKVLLDLTGSGIKNSGEFDAPSHWRLAYSYDCTSFGTQGNFQVFVEQGSTPVDAPVNELGMKGQSTSDVYHGGKLHLSMNSECNWHVTATPA
jgi:hypothetical protein